METDAMLAAIKGMYRDGSIQFTERPTGIPDDTPVIVTFLSSKTVDLRARGIDEAQAADLRARLATFADDWNSPEMTAYGDYDATKAAL